LVLKESVCVELSRFFLTRGENRPLLQQSVTRTAIIGRVQKAPYLGWCCFRALFDASKLKDIPELAWITEGVSGGKFVAPKDEPFRALFLNLCRDGTVINLVALYVDPEKDDSSESRSTFICYTYMILRVDTDRLSRGSTRALQRLSPQLFASPRAAIRRRVPEMAFGGAT
jgi:hypothetical protein